MPTNGGGGGGTGGQGGGGGGGGGGQGGGGNNKKKKKKKRQGLMSLMDLFNYGMNLSNPVKQTRRDMRAIYGPQIRGLKSDYNQYANQMGHLYDILGRELTQTAAPAMANFENINQGYTQGAQDILGAVPTTGGAESDAFLGSLGAMALAGSKDIAGMGAMENRNNASMQNQASIESMILQRNARGDLQEALDEIRKARGEDFRSTLDDNRQAAFERMLALKEFQLRAAAVGAQTKGDKWMRQFYADMFGDTLGGNGGGGGGGGGQGGGGAGGGQGGQQAPFRPRQTIRRLVGEDSWQDLNKRERKGARRYIRQNATGLEGLLNQFLPGDPIDFDMQQIMPQIRELSRMNLSPEVIQQIMQAFGGALGGGNANLGHRG